MDERRLCTVDRPSDRDHLFTREGEGCEGPLEHDGTTRRSRGEKRHMDECSLNVSRRSGIVVVSVFHGRAPKARRETFMTTETSLGKLSRVSEGHLKLIPRPWRSLGACRPVFGCRLLVSGSGLPEPCQKRRPWGIGVSRLKRYAPEMRPDVSLVTLALRGIFRVPYWAPFDASVTR
ncbi:hypothetical protein CDL15_Pgr002710 [Punica granatum]|uniref:Uncharacterized protein n=1 Tax=Punica granatum TaxID=22663 RepID=A0A218Y0E6_PUNGR|nr:hypothetical protein CDL15_Pgr002710 [Punica granatum]